MCRVRTPSTISGHTTEKHSVVDFRIIHTFLSEGGKKKYSYSTKYIIQVTLITFSGCLTIAFVLLLLLLLFCLYPCCSGDEGSSATNSIILIDLGLSILIPNVFRLPLISSLVSYRQFYTEY